MIADCEICDREQVPCKSCQESQRAICYRCGGDVDDPYCEGEQVMTDSTFNVAQAPGALIEACAKIAEPWAGFWLDKSSTDADRAVVAVRTEIAAKIRALMPAVAQRPSVMNAVILTEKLIQAAVDYESGRCSQRELSQARAAIETALAQPSPAATVERPKSMWQLPEYDPERSLIDAVKEMAASPAHSSAGRESDIDKALGELLAKICSHEAIDEAMQASWNDICSDTGCHPLDIEHGKGKHLTFSPNHWANQVAKRLFVRALKLRLEMPVEPQPAQDPLAIIEDSCWDLRCRDVPTGGDDYDIVWDIIEHHQAPPKERVVGTGRSPREALYDATSPLTRPVREYEPDKNPIDDAEFGMKP